MNKNFDQSGYAAPKLVVYGDVREMTQAVGKNGEADGGSPPDPNTKTQP